MSSLFTVTVLIFCHDLLLLVCDFCYCFKPAFNSTKQLQRASLDNQANLISTVV